MSELLEKARKKSSIHANRRPSSYYSWPIGRSGFSLTYLTRADESQVELYIDLGERSLSERMFKALEESKPKIEQEFGGELQWKVVERSRSCRIYKVIDSGGWRSPHDEWSTIHDDMIDAMVRLERAIRPYVEQLPA